MELTSLILYTVGDYHVQWNYLRTSDTVVYSIIHFSVQKLIEVFELTVEPIQTLEPVTVL